MATELRGIAPRNGAMSAARKVIGAASLLVGGGVALLSGGAAHAQIVENTYLSGPDTKNLSIHLGALLPSEKDARQYGGRYVYGGEIAYKIQVVPLQNSVGYVSVGYYERNGLRIIPFSLSQIWREPNRTFFGQHYYYGAGVSLNSVRFNSPDTEGKNKVLFGFSAIGGLDFGSSYFAELKYSYIFKYDRKFVGGFFPSVGVRF